MSHAGFVLPSTRYNTRFIRGVDPSFNQTMSHAGFALSVMMTQHVFYFLFPIANATALTGTHHSTHCWDLEVCEMDGRRVGDRLKGFVKISKVTIPFVLRVVRQCDIGEDNHYNIQFKGRGGHPVGAGPRGAT